MKRISSISIIGITLVAFSIILFSINTFQISLKNKLTNDIYSRLAELSVNNAASITAKVNDQLEMMEALALYISDKDLYSEDVRILAEKTVSAYGFLRCAITFPDKSFITHDGKSGDASANDYVDKAFLGQNCVTGPQAAVVQPDRTVILLSVPIKTDKDKIIGVLTCTYETIFLNRVFQMTSFNGQGYSYIADIDGNIICESGMDNTIYDGTNIMDFFKHAITDEQAYNSISNNLSNLKSGASIFNIDGKEKFVSYQPLGINDWYVFSVTSSSVLKTQLDNILKDVYKLSIVITVSFAIMAALIAYYIYIMQKKSKDELQKLAYSDNLTGIANKNLFEKDGRKLLDTTQSEYAYIILNVNKFKIINDIFGFADGDRFLKHIAHVISEETGKNEVCARFEADNFHILYEYGDKEILEKRLLSISDKINTYYFEKDIPHILSVGFGVYVIQDKTKAVNLMGDKARMALSKIKGIHSSAIYFYNSTISAQLMNEQEIESRMKDALKNGEMNMYLQPKYSTYTHEVVGAEALVRWITPDKGMIMPDKFIPLFERNGFVIELDIYMVEKACQLLREWQDNNSNITTISVNQSRQCLYQPNYILRLTGILSKYNISPTLIELEVTERAFLEDETALVSIIQELHGLGFMVAMDDFGSGYSSLNMLQDVNVDVLKIDKNFFRESINSERGKKIVSNIVLMATDLDIKVIAEGIETKEQLEFLKQINCGMVQGFYFSKPLDIQSFEEVLRKDSL